MREALRGRNPSTESCVGETKGTVEWQDWQNHHVDLWAERCAGRVVYSLEGKDKQYEFDVDFQ